MSSVEPGADGEGAAPFNLAASHADNAQGSHESNHWLAAHIGFHRTSTV